MRTLVHTVTIPADASVSNALDLDGKLLCGIIMPSAWTTAANITFTASFYDQETPDVVWTFVPVYRGDTGQEIALTGVAASVALMIDPSLLAGCRVIKLRSGTLAAAVNQAAARDIQVVLRDQS